MTVGYIVKIQVNITMLDYIKKIPEFLESAEPNDSGTKSSVAPLSLFLVGEGCEKTSKEKYEKFHKIIEKILFATKRALLDTGTAIS